MRRARCPTSPGSPTSTGQRPTFRQSCGSLGGVRPAGLRGTAIRRCPQPGSRASTQATQRRARSRSWSPSSLNALALRTITRTRTRSGPPPRLARSPRRPAAGARAAGRRRPGPAHRPAAPRPRERRRSAPRPPRARADEATVCVPQSMATSVASSQAAMIDPGDPQLVHVLEPSDRIGVERHAGRVEPTDSSGHQLQEPDAHRDRRGVTTAEQALGLRGPGISAARRLAPGAGMHAAERPAHLVLDRRRAVRIEDVALVQRRGDKAIERALASPRRAPDRGVRRQRRREDAASASSQPGHARVRLVAVEAVDGVAAQAEPRAVRIVLLHQRTPRRDGKAERTPPSTTGSAQPAGCPRRRARRWCR